MESNIVTMFLNLIRKSEENYAYYRVGLGSLDHSDNWLKFKTF